MARWEYVLGVLGLSIGFFVWMTVAFLPYEAGWAGLPGTVSEVSCTPTPYTSDHHWHTVCTGMFHSATINTSVTLAYPLAFDPAGTYPARLHPDTATVSVVASKTVARTLTFLLLAVAGMVFGVGSVLGRVRRWRRHGVERGKPRRISRLAIAVVIPLVLALVALIVTLNSPL